jgi:predicted ATPase
MLDLVGLLADSKSRILVLTTCRNDDKGVMNRVHHIFSAKARTTWIDLAPLDQAALGRLVSTTLQRSEEDIAPLTRLVTRVSMGNPFQARNLLQTVWRQGHVRFLLVNASDYYLLTYFHAVDLVRMGGQPVAVSRAVRHER